MDIKLRVVNNNTKAHYVSKGVGVAHSLAARKQSTLGVSSENPARYRKTSSTTGNCLRTWSADCTSVTELAFRTSFYWRTSAASLPSLIICVNDSKKISFTWVESVIKNDANIYFDYNSRLFYIRLDIFFWYFNLFLYIVYN